MKRYCYLFLLLSTMGLYTSCSKDSNVTESLSTDKQSISIMGSSSGTFQINSNTEWTLQYPTNNWLQITPTSGSGNATVTCKVNLPNAYRERRLSYAIISAKNIDDTYIHINDSLKNTAPDITTAVADYPTDGGTNISDATLLLKWEPANDAEKDRVYYNLDYSTDGTTWTSLAKKLWTPMYSSGMKLTGNTKYYWRIQAVDIFGAVSAYSKIFSFTTASSPGDWKDGEVRLFQNCVNKTATDPFTLIVTGDGFTADDMKSGGSFDTWSLRAIEALLNNIEPYKTWGQYLRIFRIGAVSAESGVSISGNSDNFSGTPSVSVNTKFKTIYVPGSETLCGSLNRNGIVSTLQANLQDAGYNVSKNFAILVIMNASIYKGTDYFYPSVNGTMGFLTLSPGGIGSQTGFEDVVCHEIGGHGIGHLADLYTNYSTSAPTSELLSVSGYHAIGWFKNVSTTGDTSQCPWSFFFNTTDCNTYYTTVGTYEGGDLYQKGIWRSESNATCMNDNRLYYDAPSRYAIVEQLKEAAGEGLTWAEFVNKDYDRLNANVTRSSFVKVKGALPLHPPILCK